MIVPLSQASILVVGLARDCERQLCSSIESLSDALSASKSVKFLIIESDSTDSTVSLLSRETSRRSNFFYRSLGCLSHEFPLRTERIAFCRNYYLEIIRNSNDYKDIDYVVVADLDGVNALIDSSSIASCWSRSDWDVCTANQSGNYYDIWALRHPLWSPNDCWSQSNYLIAAGANRFVSIFSSTLLRMIHIDSSHDWIEVESAFGGLAIYRRSLLDSGAFYKGVNEFGDQVCEHVSLHAQIRSMGGRIFINPMMMNTSPREHVKHLSCIGLVRLWFKCHIKDLASSLVNCSFLKRSHAK